MEMEQVSEFKKEYRFLSNFFRASFRDDNGLLWQTAEHRYQAYKVDPNHPDYLAYVGEIITALNPGEAKRIGYRVPLRPDWEIVKIFLMYKTLSMKFGQNIVLREKLIATGNALLIEGNTWGDRFWGVCGGKGDNYLGRLLMDLRRSYRAGM